MPLAFNSLLGVTQRNAMKKNRNNGLFNISDHQYKISDDEMKQCHEIMAPYSQNTVDSLIHKHLCAVHLKRRTSQYGRNIYCNLLQCGHNMLVVDLCDRQLFINLLCGDRFNQQIAQLDHCHMYMNRSLARLICPIKGSLWIHVTSRSSIVALSQRRQQAIKLYLLYCITVIDIGIKV